MATAKVGMKVSAPIGKSSGAAGRKNNQDSKRKTIGKLHG
jgi:hypothetical protein